MKSKIRFRENNFSTSYIYLPFISFFGLFFLVTMYLWSPQSKTDFFLQKQIILSLFIVICLLGIIAAIFPSTCKTLMRFQKDFKQQKDSKQKMINRDKTINRSNLQFEGHHPDCGKFSSHTLTINGKKYCPGCLGLSVGALIAIVGVMTYYFEGFPLFCGQISFWIGVCTVFLALILIVFFNLGKKMKLISNLALVIGSFLILLGLDTVKGNFIIELYFLILAIFWILTRIMVSETSHEIICRGCREESICVYE